MMELDTVVSKNYVLEVLKEIMQNSINPEYRPHVAHNWMHYSRLQDFIFIKKGREKSNDC